MERLKSAFASAAIPTIAAQPPDVTQGPANNFTPSYGQGAIILPARTGPIPPSNPVTLAELGEVFGYRRDRWTKQYGAIAGSEWTQGWYEAVNLLHHASTIWSFGIPALHFILEGQSFEVLFGGTNINVTLMVDGQYATSRYIRYSLTGGIEGPALDSYDTYARFDFGSPRRRKVSLYATSSLGPVTLAIAPTDSITSWDRSTEPVMFGMADSYGQARSTNWISAGIFHEAAMRLGIPHLDINAIGGTGYAPNNTNNDTRNPGNAFPARIPAMTDAQPEIFVTAGGINDNDGAAAPPLYTTAEDARLGFQTALTTYFRDLRAALPNTVLVALGPWHPNEAYYPDAVRAKADKIKAALAAVAPPWVFVDNLASGWANSSGVQDTGTGVGWQTGTGTVADPRGDGNGDFYVSADGTHPSEAGAVYLGARLAQSIEAAIRTL